MENKSTLIFLHGAPAVGKLTVARSILTKQKGILLDNHIFIDFAKSVFEFGEDGFFDLVRTARILTINSALKQNKPLIICTSCYSEPEDDAQVLEFESSINEYKGEFLPVFLECSKEKQYDRVTNTDRSLRGKLTTTEGLDNFTKQWNFVPLKRDNCLKIDTSNLSPDEVAEIILNRTHLVANRGTMKK